MSEIPIATVFEQMQEHQEAGGADGPNLSLALADLDSAELMNAIQPSVLKSLGLLHGRTGAEHLAMPDEAVLGGLAAAAFTAGVLYERRRSE